MVNLAPSVMKFRMRNDGEVVRVWWWSGFIENQGELWSGSGCVGEAVMIRVNCGQGQVDKCG